MFADDPATGFDNTIDLDAYFQRIRYNGSTAPTLATLTALARAHIGAIPFETVDVLLGRPVDLAPQAVDRKILTDGRGGYCFEHESLMRRALLALGFPVEQHLARVWVGAPAGAPPPATHASLKVNAEGKRWLIDVGFGGYVPPAPLEWGTEAPQETAFGPYRIIPSSSGWMLELRIDGKWVALYEILDLPWRSIDFDVANYFVSTNPRSHFQRDLVVARTLAGERLTLLNTSLKRTGTNGTREEHVLDVDGILRALGEIFGIPVEDGWRAALKKVVNA